VVVTISVTLVWTEKVIHTLRTSLKLSGISPTLHRGCPKILTRSPPWPHNGNELQTRFNLNRWLEIAADPRWAKLPERIETDRHGHILTLRSTKNAHFISTLALPKSGFATSTDRSLFFVSSDRQQSTSLLCPAFPQAIPELTYRAIPRLCPLVAPSFT
jgi:hypothetical protein